MVEESEAEGMLNNVSQSGPYNIPSLRTRGFKVASLNITSLIKHIDELRIFMFDQVLDILAINETRLDQSISDTAINLPGYRLVRSDRNRRGGGVCIYIRETIQHRIRNSFEFQTAEAICLEIQKPNSRPFVILACYRPPNYLIEDPFFDSLESLTSQIDTENKDLILMGDLNCDYLSTSDNLYTKKLKAVCEIYQLSQIIEEPTRICRDSNTLIDVIITNSPERLVSSGVSHIGISDHSLVYAIRKISIPSGRQRHKIMHTRKFKHFDGENFRNDLRKENWNSLKDFKSIDEMWDKWKTVFESVANKHAPIRTKRFRNKRQPWFNSTVRDAIIKRDILKREFNTNRSDDSWQKYKQARNFSNNTIKQAKRNYYNAKLCESNKYDPRETWRTINELTHRKQKNNTICEIQVDNTKYDDPKEISEVLNTHFSSLGPRLSSQLPDSSNSFEDYVQKVSNCSFKLQIVNTNSVLDIIKNLSSHKATGLDEISCRLLKEAAPVITDPLTYIFNNSIENGVFPKDWKTAKVIPLHKGNEKSDPNNYRPISIINSVAKIFERIVYDQLYEYLSTNNLLHKRQSGFRPGHSTTTALLDATNEWFFNVDHGLVTAVAFLDLAKAFDTVNHNILIRKLQLYGIDDKSTLSWFQSYLSDRTQRCFVEGSLSNPATLSCGVPQGTILGPLLFLVYINDLPNCLSSNSTARSYADDTNITIAAGNFTELEKRINHELDNVNNWLISNRLSLNSSKTEYMIVASNYKLGNLCWPLNVKLGGNLISRTNCSKSLGVYLDERLSWNDQIQRMSKKVSSAIGGLRQIRDYVPLSTLISTYKAFIQPIFDYCDIVWGSLNKEQSNHLQRLQNRAARVITRSSYDIRSADILENLGLDNLSNRRLKHSLNFMHKVVHGDAPVYLTDSITYVQNNDGRSHLRGSTNLHLERPRSEAMKRSFAYRGASVWNKLPPEIKSLKSHAAFREHVNTSLSLPGNLCP